MAAQRDPFLGRAVGPAPADEGPADVAAAGREVEEPRLQRRREPEARVQHVAHGREQRVHVPDQAGGGEGGEDEGGVAEEADDAEGVGEGGEDAELGRGAEAAQEVGFGLVDCLWEEEVGEDGGEGGEGELQVEQDAPGGVGYDDAADEGAEGRTD